jgi:hypothetical protein
VTNRTKQAGVILTLVAMVSFAAWPFWKALYFNVASTALQNQATELAGQNPALQVALKVALVDGILTESEAQLIVDSGAKAEP